MREEELRKIAGYCGNSFPCSKYGLILSVILTVILWKKSVPTFSDSPWSVVTLEKPRLESFEFIPKVFRSSFRYFRNCSEADFQNGPPINVGERGEGN